jgi:hypothetical protein
MMTPLNVKIAKVTGMPDGTVSLILAGILGVQAVEFAWSLPPAEAQQLAGKLLMAAMTAERQIAAPAGPPTKKDG